MKWIDTHAHLNLPAFTNDIEAVVEKCATESVAVINIGTKKTTSARAVELAKANASFYAIIGLHPIQTVPNYDEVDPESKEQSIPDPAEIFAPEFYRDLASSSKVVGIGECGFDYFHTPTDSYLTQESAFIAQIKLANELNLPLMIHTRGPKPGESSPTGRSVYLDVLAVLKQYAKVPGNVHFFAGTYEEAKQFIDLGFTVSFTGVITFASVYEEVVKAVPLEYLHAETDCPYVAPIPYRGQRAEPWMVKSVYKKIAEIKNLAEEEVRLQLLKNAETLYKITLH